MELPVQLQASEELVTVRKRHPVYVILKSVLAVLIAGLVIWLLSWLSGQFASDSSIWFWLYVAAVVVTLAYIGLLFYGWRNDLWIVTDQRLIDSQRKSPFNQTTSSTDLVNVQDISVRKSGVMASVLNFGDVLCQTASTQGAFVFRGVSEPAGLMELLDRVRDEARKSTALHMGQAIGQATQQGTDG